MKVLDSKEFPMQSLTAKVGRTQLESFERLIGLRRLGHTAVGCARIMCVSRETIRLWEREPLFIAMMTRERSDFIRATAETVISGTLDAVRLLVDCVTDIRIPKQDRVPAAQALVELSDKLLGAAPQNLTFNDKTSNDPQLGEILFPKVIADKKPKQKKLPAPVPELKEGQ
jgi:hypothetical protein